MKSAADGRRLLNWIGVGFVLVATVAVIERYSGISVNGLFPRHVDTERFYWAAGSSSGVTSTYPHRILLGLACSLGALIYLQDLILGNSKIRKGVLFVGAVLCMAALYFSMSRGPWLAFAVGFFALTIMVGARSIRWGALIGFLVIAVLLLRPGVWSTISGLQSATFDPNSVKGQSYKWRFVVIETALREMSKAELPNKLFGFGGGSQLMTDFGKFEVAPGIWLPIESWDCEYAAVLYDKGWVGLLLLLLLSGAGLVRVAGLMRGATDNLTRSTALSVFVGLLVFAFARTNVALYAAQLVYAEMAFFGIGSALLDRVPVPNEEQARLPSRFLGATESSKSPVAIPIRRE